MARKRKPFYFKEFTILHERSALPVGTDAVLLGTLSTLAVTPRTILDIGTGCGVVALMLAQRYPDSRVVGVEVDELSYLEASENALASPFADRVEICHADFTSFEAAAGSFDLIVSNPPYFTETHRSATDRKTLAKHIGTLTPQCLLGGAEALLSEQGAVVVVLALSSFPLFMRASEETSLSVEEVVYVSPMRRKPASRVVVSWGKDQTQSSVSLRWLCMQEAHLCYTEEYRRLVEPFLQSAYLL